MSFALTFSFRMLGRMTAATVTPYRKDGCSRADVMMGNNASMFVLKQNVVVGGRPGAIG